MKTQNCHHGNMHKTASERANIQTTMYTVKIEKFFINTGEFK